VLLVDCCFSAACCLPAPSQGLAPSLPLLRLRTFRLPLFDCRCFVACCLPAHRLPWSGVAAYGASARSPSSLLTWLVPPQACIMLSHPGTAAARALAFPATGRFPCTQHCRLPRQRATRLAVPPSQRDYPTHLLAHRGKDVERALAFLSHRSLPPHGDRNNHIVVVSPNTRSTLSAIPRREAIGSRLSIRFGASQVGNSGHIPGRQPPSSSSGGVAAPPILGISHLSPGHAPHALSFPQPP
jgi:hypothetical protein